MNKNEECSIVKDLSSQYIDNIVSPDSKLFIEKHIENCCDCKKYYEDMKINILEEKNVEYRKENYELDYLKKIRKNMNILKIIIAIFFIVIFFIIGYFCIKYAKLNSIINQSYNKIEYMKNLSNYQLVKETNYINLKDNTSLNVTTNYYYKDGKYKIDSGNNINYYEDNSYNKICVYNDLKLIEYYESNVIEMKKGIIFNTFSEIISYKNNLNGIYKLALSIKNNRFNGIDCYVIRFGNDNSYKDIWISKKDFMVLRVVEEEYLDYFREELYSFTTNETTNDDVDASILNTDLYKDYTKNNYSYDATEEEKEYYNQIYK